MASVNQKYLKDEDGTIFSPIVSLNSIKKGTGFPAELLDIFYPVGTYYETSNIKFNPNDEWGGEWERDTTGTVLMSEGTYRADQTLVDVGEKYGTKNKTIKLATTNLPAHTHTYAKSAANTGSHTLTVKEIPAHAHTVKLVNRVRTVDDAFVGVTVDASRTDNTGTANTANAGGGGGHTHTISTTSTNSGSTGSGTGVEFEVMQPSLCCVRWHRIK